MVGSRAGGRTVAQVLMLLAGLGVVGCSEGVEDASDSSSTSEAGHRAVDQTETPAARSGDLGQEDLPRPESLGPGWTYRVDMGDVEEGYVGSGEPAIARDPASVLAAITPLGCDAADLPMPTNALEVTYRRGPVPGVGLALSFEEESGARAFFDGHAGVLRHCTEARRVDVQVLTDEPQVFVSTRTEELGHTPSWAEAMSIDGTEVMLIAVADPTRRGIDAAVSAVG